MTVFEKDRHVYFKGLFTSQPDGKIQNVPTLVVFCRFAFVFLFGRRYFRFDHKPRLIVLQGLKGRDNS